MRTFFVMLAVGVLFFGIYGCEEEQQRREGGIVSEDVAREIERDLDRELERAEQEIDRVRDRLEERFNEEDLTDEQLESIRKEVEESVSTGIARVGRVLEEIGARIQEDAEVNVTDYRDFQELLPDELMDMDRRNWDGSNKSALGMRFSKLEAVYEGRRSNMEIAILDLGTMKGLAAMGFDFIDKNIDEEDRNGYKRTREFRGWPGLETVEYREDSTEMQGVLIVDQRFVIAVNAEGERMDKDFIEDLFDELDIRDLERMAR